MKPSMLGLLIAAGAFGASTVYLSLQLREERERADQILAESRALNARLAELERARADLDALRAAAPPAASQPMPAATPGGPSAAALAAGEAPGAGPAADRGFRPGTPPERSEAFQKMLRSQLRGNYKRLYADIGKKLGLSPEKSGQLVDLITDQQVAMMERARTSRSMPVERMNQENLEQIADLVGTDKLELFKQYQDTLPARQEVEMLSRQLEGNDLALSQQQHERMVTALVEERGRVPAPSFVESTSPDEFRKAMSAWQEDYNERSAARARSILNAEQVAAFNEYQQWSREMRQNFEQRRAGRPGAAGSTNAADASTGAAPRP